MQVNPKDAHGQYLLGRVHGAAFGQKTASIRMMSEAVEDLDRRYPENGCGAVGAQLLQAKVLEPRLTGQELLAHLTTAIRHLSIAVDLAPEDPLYRIGFACAIDSGAHLAPEIDSLVMSVSVFGSMTEQETTGAA
ncbi:MAG: hypothetical protein ABIP42_18825, partial [Planctomycetota bacterium]